MGLLHSLLFGGMLAGSAVRAADHNRDAKKNSFTMPNGIEYYYDRRGVMKLMNGTRIERRNGGFYNSITGELLYSAEKERVDKDNRETISALHSGKAEGYKYIMVRDPLFTCPMCLEVATNKYISRLEKGTYRGETGLFNTYYKAYWDYKSKRTAPGGKLYDGLDFDIETHTKITQEEFEEIKNAYCPNSSFKPSYFFLQEKDYTDWGIVQQGRLCYPVK